MIQEDIFSYTVKKISSCREVQDLLADKSFAAHRFSAAQPGLMQCEKLALKGPTIFLQLDELSKIVEHEPSDLVVGVEPGIKLAHLNEKLAHYEQIFPVSAGGQMRLIDLLTLGDGGALETAYGALRSNVLGLHFVDHAGILIKSGGRVVKNVTGYDVTKLFVGSPWFGMPVLVYLRLFARQPDKMAYRARGLSLESALRFSQKLLSTDISPSILEIVEEETKNKFTLFVSVEGALQAVPLLAQSIDRLGTGSGLALSPYFDEESAALRDYIAMDRMETTLFADSALALTKAFSESRPGRLRLRPALNKVIVERKEGEDLTHFVESTVAEFKSALGKVQRSSFESGQVILKLGAATIGGINSMSRLESDVLKSLDPDGRFCPFVCQGLSAGDSP